MNINSFVDPMLLQRLERWVERYIGSQCRTALLPFETLKHVFTRFTDKHTGVLKIRIDTYQALDPAIRSTKKKQTIFEDEFGGLFRHLAPIEQLVLLTYVDPFGELQTEEAWRQFLRDYQIYNQSSYDRLLAGAFVRLQLLAREKGVEGMTEKDSDGELWGLDQIAEYMQRSVPTVMKWAREHGMPMAMVGGVTYSTKLLLKQWKLEQLTKNRYSDKTQDIDDKRKGPRMKPEERRQFVLDKRKKDAKAKT